LPLNKCTEDTPPNPLNTTFDHNSNEAQKSLSDAASQPVEGVLKDMMTHMLRIARLKLLFIAAKVVKDSNRDKVKYSIHDVRTPAMLHFLKFLDEMRSEPKPWGKTVNWTLRFAIS